MYIAYVEAKKVGKTGERKTNIHAHNSKNAHRIVRLIKKYLSSDFIEMFRCLSTSLPLYNGRMIRNMANAAALHERMRERGREGDREGERGGRGVLEYVIEANH